MKHLFTMILGMLMLGFSFSTQAAFPMKNHAQPAPVQTINETATNGTIAVAKQHHKTKWTKRVANTLPQVVYVLLAIFWLGWLAMGINDNFEGTDWLISLLLYVILYLPGLIFTLIKMGKYY